MKEKPKYKLETQFTAPKREARPAGIDPNSFDRLFRDLMEAHLQDLRNAMARPPEVLPYTPRTTNINWRRF